MRILYKLFQLTAHHALIQIIRFEQKRDHFYITFVDRTFGKEVHGEIKIYSNEIHIVAAIKTNDGWSQWQYGSQYYDPERLDKVLIALFDDIHKDVKRELS